ncbi:ABC transporter permease [candidate division KSB1 bacterium]
MLNLLKLSYRNVFRNWRRSALTLSAIMFSIIFTIYGISLVKGQKTQMTTTSRTTNTSDLKIFAEDYLEERETLPLDIVIENPSALINQIKTLDEVEEVSPRIVFSIRLFFSNDELICSGAGIDPFLEDGVYSRKEGIILGEYLKNDDEGVLVGSDLARLINVGPGDFIMVASRTRYGTITALDLEIKGIIESGNPEIDNFFVFFTLKSADEFLEMENSVTEIAVKLKDHRNAEKIRPDIKNILGGKYGIRTYSDELEDILMLLDLRMKSLNIFSFLLFLMAAFVVANTMLMSVFERKKEIGTLMALGMKNREILGMILGEGVFIGVFGGIIGSVLGGLISYYLKVHGMSLDAWSEMSMNMPFKGTLYGEFSMSFIIIVFIISVAVAVLSSIYPAVKVTKFQPAEILDSSEI